MTTFELRISLNPNDYIEWYGDYTLDSYFWWIQATEEDGTQYNTGYCGWAQSPFSAVDEASVHFDKLKTET